VRHEYPKFLSSVSVLEFLQVMSSEGVFDGRGISLPSRAQKRFLVAPEGGDLLDGTSGKVSSMRE